MKLFGRAELLVIAVAVSMTGMVFAQRGPGGRGPQQPPQPPRSPKAGAPVDITGTWVSIVAEDYRYRMLTPLKGDYAGLPLNPEAKKIADAWDPGKDEAAGEQCKGYGAGNIMRMPGHFRIGWQDEETLKVDIDTGSQTRMFYFGTPKSQGGDWQGVSKASWEFAPGPPGPPPTVGSLKVVTTNFKPGYLRKNGVPYGANAIVTEYFDRINERDGSVYLVVTRSVEDPMYLTLPYHTSVHFRKEANDSGWKASLCTSR